MNSKRPQANETLQTKAYFDSDRNASGSFGYQKEKYEELERVNKTELDRQDITYNSKLGPTTGSDFGEVYREQQNGKEPMSDVNFAKQDGHPYGPAYGYSFEPSAPRADKSEVKMIHTTSKAQQEG